MFNGYSSPDNLLSEKRGNLVESDIFDVGTDNMNKLWVNAIDGSFTLEYVPWDPDSDQFRMSYFTFVCLANNFQPDDNAVQICGKICVQIWNN